MDPERKKLLENLKARKAELDARQADIKGRAAVVSKGLQEMELLRFEASVKKKLYDYGGEYGCIVKFRKAQKVLLESIEYRTVFKRPSCLELVKEYCAVDAVGAAAVGMAAVTDEHDDDDSAFFEDATAVGMAAAADDDTRSLFEDADAVEVAVKDVDAVAVEDVDAVGAAVSAAVSIIDRIGQCLSESERILREKFANKANSDRYKKFFQIHLLGLKTLSETTIEKEYSLLNPIEKAIKRKLITEEKANQMLFGNLDAIRTNREKSVLLSACQTQLTRQLPSSKSEFSAKLLGACFLWDGVSLELPDRLDLLRQRLEAGPQLQAQPPQLQARPPQLQARPPSVSGVFMKTKSKTFPSLTKKERFVTIDETGFSWFDKDSRESISSIPLGQIVGAEAAGKWGELFGVDIMHRGDGDHTFLWCDTLEKQKKIIETVRALVALKKGGNKNRKTIIKYRKRRHQNKKKTHKKNANKKSTKKNIRKSKTKKNN